MEVCFSFFTLRLNLSPAICLYFLDILLWDFNRNPEGFIKPTSFVGSELKILPPLHCQC